MDCQFCRQGALARDDNGGICPDCWEAGYGERTAPDRPKPEPQTDRKDLARAYLDLRKAADELAEAVDDAMNRYHVDEAFGVLTEALTAYREATQ